MRYDSPEHIETYKSTGQFPKIHDTLAALIEDNIKPGKTAFDLGSCYGLMTIRLVSELGWAQALGIEGNINYFRKVIPRDNVLYLNMKITEESLDKELGSLFHTLNPELVVARRVFPEINEQNPKALLKLADMCKAFGTAIALEGRNPHHQPTNALSSAEREVAIFKDKGYEVIAKAKNCYILTI
jgi:hypothetical protein